MKSPYEIDPKRDLVERMKRTYSLIVDFAEQSRLSTDLLMKERNRRHLQEQWQYLNDDLGRYMRLCDALGYQIDKRVLEIVFLVEDVLIPTFTTEKYAQIEREGFERQVLGHVDFEDSVIWRENQERCELAVCLIEINNEATGTGFLVADDVIITCYHVIEPVFTKPQLKASVKFRFDYKVPNAGISPARENPYGLREDSDWYLKYSLESWLDYVVLCTNENPGAEQILLNSTSIARGYLKLTPRELNEYEPLIILQHPEGAPLKIAAGAVMKTTHSPPRLVYSTTTDKGSSGAPCFAHGWELVALHHYGDPTGNRAVPFSAIWDDMKTDERLHGLIRLST